MGTFAHRELCHRSPTNPLSPQQFLNAGIWALASVQGEMRPLARQVFLDLAADLETRNPQHEYRDFAILALTHTGTPVGNIVLEGDVRLGRVQTRVEDPAIQTLIRRLVTTDVGKPRRLSASEIVALIAIGDEKELQRYALHLRIQSEESGAREIERYLAASLEAPPSLREPGRLVTTQDIAAIRKQEDHLRQHLARLRARLVTGDRFANIVRGYALLLEGNVIGASGLFTEAVYRPGLIDAADYALAFSPDDHDYAVDPLLKAALLPEDDLAVRVIPRPAALPATDTKLGRLPSASTSSD